jgi:uncharacterized protein YndB with AHSA1/START domain
VPSEITVSVVIPASRRLVWEEASRLEDHVEWMADARSITFLTAARSGVGTRMAVETRVGPFHTDDVMEIVAWEPGRRIAVEHRGLFIGRGEFLLEDGSPDTTRFTWTEQIEFPARFGGPLGAAAARPILRWVWRRNLARFRSRISRR